jgi:hypothetical protein
MLVQPAWQDEKNVRLLSTEQTGEYSIRGEQLHIPLQLVIVLHLWTKNNISKRRFIRMGSFFTPF